jgi:hypothetical protein
LPTTRKTCEAMASLAGKSGDTFCRLLKEKSVTTHVLVNISKKILIGRSYYLILNAQENYIFNVFLLMLSCNLKLKNLD